MDKEPTCVRCNYHEVDFPVYGDGRIVIETTRHYCRESRYNQDKDIWNNVTSTTSPSWCPLRK